MINCKAASESCEDRSWNRSFHDLGIWYSYTISAYSSLICRNVCSTNNYTAQIAAISNTQLRSQHLSKKNGFELTAAYLIAVVRNIAATIDIITR